jgi:nitroreductase
MTEAASWEALWQARFGDGAAPPAADLPELPWLRQVLSRRSHRRYAERAVAEPLLRLLLAAAFSASSKSDFQQVAVIRVQDAARRRRLAALVPDMPWIGSAPVFFVFCGDARRLERLGAWRRHGVDNGRLEGFLNAAIDAALVLQTFVLAAETAGLGCCPISVLRDHAAAVAEILELPEKVFPVAGLCLGYPAQEGYTSLRLPLAVTLHTDRYDDSRLAELVDAYDRRRDARYSIPPARQRARGRFGEALFYGWSEDKTRQAAAESEGVEFAGWLPAHGFTLP